MAASRNDINRDQTIAAIEQAFLAEYREKGIDQISITNLCKAGSFSRSTFYFYFEDKYAVLQSVEDRLLADLWEHNEFLPDRAEDGRATASAQYVLDFLSEHQEWFRALLGPHGDPGFIYRWKSDIIRSLQTKQRSRNIAPEKAELLCSIFASGMIGFFTTILFQEKPASAEFAGRCMNRLLEYCLTE